MIRLIDVRKTLGDREVLKGLNLHVQTGDTYAILGPTGIGKSVALRHMVGLLRPDAGQVLIDGIDVAKCNRRQLLDLRKRFGMLFQSAGLFNSMRVFDNMALPLTENTQLSRGEIKARVAEALEWVGMSGTEQKMPAELSGGMKKRVGLARAIVTHPDIILYDEPTTGLDPIMAMNINNLILSLQEKVKATSVVVTHDMTSAFMISDRIGLLHQGSILEEGTTEEFKNSSNKTVQRFISGDGDLPED